MLLPVLIASALFSSVWANFELTLDKSSYTASDTLKVSWEDDGTLPNMDNYATANIKLCTYDSTNKINCPVTLGNGLDLLGTSSFSFDLSTVASEGGSGQYMLQFTAISGSSKGTYVGVYSPNWITITGFTGAVSANSGPAFSGYSSGDTGSNDLPGASDEVPSQYSNLASSWQTPYIYQHGLTRYAPFQSTPNSTVTMPMTLTRRFATSSVSMFLSYVKTPLPITTATPSPSITITRHQNYAPTITVSSGGRAASRVTPTAVVRQRRWVD